jgi:hypothetical protein
MADINDEVNAISEHLRRLNHEFDRYANLTSQSTDAVRQRSTAEKYRDQQLEASGRAAADSLKDFGRAVGTYTSTMFHGASGAAALNNTISQVTSGLGNLAISLAALVTPGGVVKKVLAAGLAAVGIEAFKLSNEIANAGREMVDAQYKSYSEMAKSGAVANEGLRGVAAGAESVGLSIEKMDKYLGLVASNSGTLAMLGKSAYDGRRQFEAVADELKGSRGMFKALGMDQDAMNEGQMGYLRLLTKTGQAQLLSADKLAGGVKNYLLEQDALTKLTGMSRKQAEDIKARALTEEKFRAEQDEMIANGQADAAKNVQDFNVVLESISPQLAAGYRAGIGGNLNSKESQQFFQATNGAMQSIIELSKTDPAKAADMLAQEVGKNNEMVRQLARQGASNSTYGDYASKADLAAFAKSKGPGGIAEAFQQILAAQQAQMGKTGVVGPDGKELAVDPRLQRQVELLDMQQQTNLLLQQLINQNLDDLKVGGKVGADYAQIEAINYEKFARARLLEYVKAANPELYNKFQTQNAGKGDLTPEVAKGLIEAADKQIAAIDQNKTEIQLALNEKQREKNIAAKNVDDSAGKSESAKIEARRELDARLAEFERLKAQLDRNIEAKDRAVKDKASLEKQLKDAKTTAPTDPKAAEAAAAEAAKAAKAAEVAKAAEAAKAAADPEARARARMEKELADQKSGNKDQSTKSEIAKLKEALQAPFPELKVGGKTAFKDLVQEQKDAINNLLEKQGLNPIMGQTPGDERGKESWDKVLKKNPEQQKALFDAINDQILIDRNKKLDDLEKKIGNKTSETAPAAPKEFSQLARAAIADLGASLDSQVAAVTTKAVNIAGALPPKTDIKDVTAGLTINADVATLNSKGMNMTLDNSADVTKMIAALAPDLAGAFRTSSQTDQSIARTSFESTIGDLKTEMAKQKATDELLLAAVQELVRIQKNGVEVQQKIYRATV